MEKRKRCGSLDLGCLSEVDLDCLSVVVSVCGGERGVGTGREGNAVGN